MVGENEMGEIDTDDTPGHDAMEAAKEGLLKKPEDADKEAAEQRKALVKKILDEVKGWEDHHDAAFKKMKRNVRFVQNKDNEQWRDPETGVAGPKGNYVANITHRLIQTKVASLYARNPRARARRRPMVDYTIWDGRQETLQSAMQTLQSGMQVMQAQTMASMGAPGAVTPPQPAMQPYMDPVMATAIVQEAIQVRERRQMIDRVGKTAEIMFHHALDMTKPSFKARMKQAIRRACTTGVAWVKLDFERAYDGYRPETNDKIRDTQDRIAKAEAAMKQLQAGDLDTQSAEIEQLRIQLEQMTKEPDMLVREGVLFDFPKSWDVILDKDCQQLIGLVGCKKMAQRYHSTKEDIQAQFGIDLGNEFRAYVPRDGKTDDPNAGKVCWYEVYDSTTGMVYTVADGYPDFLVEPTPPRVDVEQFFPYYPIVLNETETDGDLYPPSDVELVEHQQRELNRSREALRQHRIAASPFMVVGQDKLSDEDIARLKARNPHEVIQLKALLAGQKISDLIQAGPTQPIDQNLYQDLHVVQDVLRVSGVQDANLGPTTGNTATEAGIAEASRSKSDSSNVDDLDAVLTQLAHDWCRVALKNVSLEMARRIVGQGAVWPEVPESANDFSDVLFLDIVAGSSGKPNRAQDAANYERIVPTLVNVPGIQPDFLARKGVELLDEAVDMDDALLSGIPSILAMNAMIKNAPVNPAGGVENTPTGDSRSDPSQQGGMGGENAPRGMGVPGGPQPGMPAPGDAMATSMTGMP